jgi:hypothetical protein
MTEIEQATEALIAAIDAARHRLPRGAGAYQAERNLLAQCEKAGRLIHQQCRRIKQRGSRRSSRTWPPWRPVLSAIGVIVSDRWRSGRRAAGCEATPG